VNVQLVVEVGATVDVVAVDLVSGGYRWVLGPVPDGLALDAEETAGARRSFRLRGHLPGSYDVRLDLVRPWEPPEVGPVESRLVRVEVVRPGGA
jgi:hypothetical protein